MKDKKKVVRKCTEKCNNTYWSYIHKEFRCITTSLKVTGKDCILDKEKC